MTPARAFQCWPAYCPNHAQLDTPQEGKGAKLRNCLDFQVFFGKSNNGQLGAHLSEAQGLLPLIILPPEAQGLLPKNSSYPNLALLTRRHPIANSARKGLLSLITSFPMKPTLLRPTFCDEAILCLVYAALFFWGGQRIQGASRA